LLLLLRKALVAPETRARALAVYGFCGLLARGLLPSEPGAQSDAVLALRSACSMAPSLQALTFDELRNVLLAHAPTEPSACGLLYSLLLETLWWMALPGLQAAAEGTTTAATTAANAATATTMAPQPRQHVGVHGAGAMVFDAAWAASLVRHAADDEGGGAAVVLPALVRCLAVASAVLPPASCDAQHRQLRVALQQLECALQPARLVAIFSHPLLSAALSPSPKPSAKNAASLTSSGACQGGGPTTSSSGAMDATRRAQQRLHAISSLGMAIMGADMGAVARCSGADGRGAAASGKASAYMATAARSAIAAHLEAHRDDDQSAKTASRRVSPSVTAATLRGAILVASGIGSASAAGAGRVSLLAPCSRCLAPVNWEGGGGGGGGGEGHAPSSTSSEHRPPALPCGEAIQALGLCTTQMGSSGKIRPSQLAGVTLLGCYALASISEALHAHSAALEQRRLERALQPSSDTGGDGDGLHGAGGYAGGYASGSSSSASAVAALPSARGSSAALTSTGTGGSGTTSLAIPPSASGFGSGAVGWH